MCALFLAQSLFLIFFLGSGYIIGRGILADSCTRSRAENIAFSTTAGWGLLACALAALGFAKRLTPHAAVLVYSLLFTAALIRNFHILKKGAARFFLRADSPFSGFDTPSIIIITASAAYALAIFYFTLFPITAWDALSYYLPAAREFLLRRAIVPLSDLRYPAIPQLSDMFLLFPLILDNPTAASVVSYAMMLVLGIMVYAFGARYIDRKGGILAALIFVSAPAVMDAGIIPHTDMPAALFCFGAFYLTTAGIDEKRPSYFIFSGVLWGAALGSKYYAILFLAVTAAAMLIVFRKRMQPRHCALMLLTAAVVCFPWYARSKICAGDWFFPMFSSGSAAGGQWDMSDSLQQSLELRSFGAGSSPHSLPALPYTINTHPEAFQGTPGVVLSVFLLLGYMLLPRMPAVIVVCMLGITLYGFVWISNFQITRYLLPVLPLWAVVSGWIARCPALPAARKELIWRLTAAAAIVLGASAALGTARAYGVIPSGSRRTEEYLSRRFPTYRAITFLNNFVAGDCAVYALFDERSRFYYKHRLLGNWFGPDSYRKIFGGAAGFSPIYSFLRARRVGYLLINRHPSYVGPLIRRPLMEQIARNVDGMEHAGLLKLIYEDDGAYIYEVETAAP